MTSRKIISVRSVRSVWDKKGHTDATETTERVASRKIISVRSVKSVWDKKGHTETTEITENVDIKRDCICEISV